MTQIVLPHRPRPGDPEDVSQVLADFDAVLNVVNGDLGNDNFSANAKLTPEKFAPGVNHQVLETVGSGVQWGDRGVPPGVIMPFLAEAVKVPPGWLLADGAAVSRVTYADLFAIIGTTYGAGDGSTTFNLPNMKGRVPVGVDAAQAEFDAVGEAGGEKAHSLTITELARHQHGANTGNDSPDHSHGGTTAGASARHRHYIGYNLSTSGRNDGGANMITGITGPSGGTNNTTTGDDSPDHAHNFGTGGASARHTHGINLEGDGTAHNNMPPFVAMNYIVKV